MRFVIVTGVSGAGKTAALKMLEDANYFCVDNLPIPLLEKFASLMPEIHGEDVQNVALGIDARSGRSLDELEAVLDRMKKAGYEFEILFLDTAEVLVKCLENEGVEYIFGIPGEENLDVMNALVNSKIRFITVRHEQGAAFMADVYGRLTGKAGVCLTPPVEKLLMVSSK